MPRATPAKKTTAPRQRTAKPPAPPAVEETPLVVFAARPADPDPVAQVLVFEQGDRKFYAPAAPPTGVALRYLKLLRTNEESAYLFLIEKLCGEQAYDALADDPATTLEDVAQVVGALRSLLQGRAEDPKA